MGWIDKLKGQRNRSSSLRRNDDAVLSGAAGPTSSGTPGEAATLPSTAAASGGGVRGDVGSPGDVDPVLQHLIRNVRSAAVRQQFHRIPASQYQSVNEVRVLVGSYNTNGVKPPSGQPLADWLQFPQTGWPRRPAPEPGTDGDAAGPLAVPEEGPDIIVLCFQELVPLSAGNVLAGASSELAGVWDRLLDANLNSCHAHSKAQQDLAQRLSSAWRGGGQEAAPQLPADEGTAPEYVQLAGKQLVGLYITVWLRQWLVPHVRGVQVAAVGTGAFGYLGNKGAVGVRLRVFDSPLSLVCAHLSSGQSDADALKRNQDYQDIMHRGAFPEEPPSDAPPADAAAAAAAAGAAVAGDLLGIAGSGADALQTSAGVCAAPVHTGELPGQWGMLNTFAEQENIVCAGDLNYRLTLPDAEVRALVQAGRYERLLAADQLYMFMDRGLAFQDWKEGILSFPPTYKYRRNTSLYVGDSAVVPSEADGGGGGALDLLSSGVAAEPDLLGLGRPSPAAPAADGGSAAAAGSGGGSGKQKSRTPAWTDRVLYKTVQGELHKIAYGRSELMLSDHKPVVAAFLLSARQYERGRVNAAVDMAWRAHDALEMRAKPVCRLEVPMVDLGEVRFQEQVTTRARLLNEGEVPACFYFLDQPSEHFPGGGSGVAAAEDDASRGRPSCRRICPDWMTVEPSGGIIPPGGAAEIDLTLTVEGGPLGVADALAAAPGMRLDVILVLRIENSSDKFISLSGIFRPSCFGLSLDRMAALANPTAASGTTPAQVQRLLSYLSQPQCLGTPGLFRDSLDDVRAASCAAEPDDTCRAAMLEAPAEQLPRIVAVRQLLDDHADLAANGVSAHEAAAAFMLLFRLLPAPLMPPAIVEMCEVCVPNANQAAQVLKDSLSATAWSTLKDSLRLLHACLAPEVTARNCLTPSQLVDVWVNIWFPPLQYPDALSALAAARLTVAARAGDGSEEDGMSEADAQLQIRIQQAVDSASRRSQLLSLFMHPLRRAEAAQQAAGVQQQQ